jgi:hypothetical protein
MERLKIFAGSSCEELAQAVCQRLGLALSKIKISPTGLVVLRLLWKKALEAAASIYSRLPYLISIFFTIMLLNFYK